MLLKHSGIYLVARAVPAILSFASLAVFTRLLPPQDYGVYVLVIATISLTNAIAFAWLEMALLRILPAHLDQPHRLLSTVLTLYLSIAAATGLAGAITAFVIVDPVMRRLVLFGIPLLWAYTWFEMNLVLYQVKLLPTRYGLMMSMRALVTLGLGSLLALWGFGGFAPLIGYCTGLAIAGILIAGHNWVGVRPRLDAALATELARYGLPLTATAALAFLVDTTDRFMISAMLGDAAVGSYAAAYDLTAFSLAMLMMVVNLAAYPLAIRAWEQGGMTAAMPQIRQNGVLLLAVAVPAAVGICMLADSIAEVVLGPAFRESGARILPWIAVATLLGGLRTFLFDLAFQLTRRTSLLIWAPAGAVVANVLLNLWLIPAYGIIGSAWAALAAYAFALVISIAIGRKALPIPLDMPQIARVLFGAAVMGFALDRIPAWPGVAGLVTQIATGVAIYGTCIVLCNVLDVRTLLLERLRLLRSGSAPRPSPAPATGAPPPTAGR